jgi:hypothetical protein
MTSGLSSCQLEKPRHGVSAHRGVVCVVCGWKPEVVSLAQSPDVSRVFSTNQGLHLEAFIVPVVHRF